MNPNYIGVHTSLGGKRLTAIAPTLIGQYHDWRRSAIALRKRPVSTATVSLEREHNERDRVLLVKEFDLLYQPAEDWLKPMLMVAYYTGMRKGEIRALRWDQIDLKTCIMRLKSGDTKTGEG